jgi:hypothetical protein
VTVKENIELVKPFYEEEIKSALFQMETNKAAVTDGIPIEFYQKCWDIIKNYIVELFKDFHNGKMDCSRINYGIITLLPKVEGADKLQQFRPICLLNCLYKWVTKVLTMRIEKVAEKLILQNQSAFMKGRNIMYGIMTLHEVLHETKRNQEAGIILKLDFEKAYHKICWEFLFESLRLRGFHEKWCGWIKEVVTRGTVAVKINNKVGPYFVSKKGVRQGIPSHQSCLIWQLTV